MNSCCCGNCSTIFKLDAALNVQWSRNFFFDYSGKDAYGGSFSTQNVYACDVDAEGNVYQVGDHSGHCLERLGLGSPLPDQTLPMYTIRSWDEKGNLRWSWSESEYGSISTDGLSRTPPTTLTSCRVAANTTAGGYGTSSAYGGSTPEMILVGTDARAGNTTGSKITALDTDGNLLWMNVIDRFIARVHSVGATRSLWRIRGEIYSGDSNTYPATGWLIIRNSDGATLYNSLTSPSWSGPSVAAMDSDDSVYEMSANYESWAEGVNLIGVTRVTRYVSDGAVIDWSVASCYMSGGIGGIWLPITSPSAAGLGVDISLEQSTLIVSTGSAFERFTKSNGSHVSIRRTPISQLYVTDAGGIAALTQVADYTYRPQSVVGVFTSSGDRFKLWDGNTVADVRRTPDGGMIVSAQKNCPSLGMPAGKFVPDLNVSIISCSSKSTFTASSVWEAGYFNTTNHTGIGSTTWTADGGCASGCKSLSVDIVGQISNTYYQQMTFVGYQIVAGFPVGNVTTNLSGVIIMESGQPAIPAPHAGDVVSFDCF